MGNRRARASGGWAIGPFMAAALAVTACGRGNGNPPSPAATPVAAGKITSALSSGPCAQPLPESAEAASVVQALKEGFSLATPEVAAPPVPSSPSSSTSTGAPLLRDSLVACIDQTAAGLVPHFRADAVSGSISADVLLPLNATGAFTLSDAASGISLSVTLDGAFDAAAEVSDGYVVYRGALGTGVDVVHRVTAAGTEDYIACRAAAGAHDVRYSLSMPPSIGLRLIGNALEFVDATGTPRLRLQAPFLVDSSGIRHDAETTVEGCQVDTNPAPPWGRPVTSAGTSMCAVRVRWPQGVAYPAALDPGWTSTSSMAEARAAHTATRLLSGRVLAVAGSNATGFLASAEIYDPTSSTWATTGSLPSVIDGASTVSGRQNHTATLLPSGKVLVAGGYGGYSTRTTLLFDPSSGTWSAAAPMLGSRGHHTAVALSDGRVLVAGGFDSFAFRELDTAEVYDPTAGTWQAVGPMAVKRRFFPGTLLANGRVLVSGGIDTISSVVHSSAQLFDSATGSWSNTTPLGTARYDHSQNILADGRVLAAGGVSSAEFTPVFATTTELYSLGSGAWAFAGSLARPRAGHRGVLLQDGRVLVAGGSPYPQTAELFDPAAGTWADGGTLVDGRVDHTASLLTSGLVLLAGGHNGNPANVLATAERFDSRADGVACRSGADCSTALCIGGTCGCPTGFADCDGLPANGCEASLLTDATHCGSCGTACSGINKCSNGLCCGSTGKLNCDGDASNGCETPISATNCGVCGVVCTAAHALQPGLCFGLSGCQPPSCVGFWANCDGNNANGCETPTDSDTSNCGGCGFTCSGANVLYSVCSFGTCTGTCAPGFVDCNANLRTDGCEAPAVDNCGACGDPYGVCSSNHIARSCTDGTNCDGICSPGYLDCNGNKRADGCEITEDVSNCGTCGHVCSQSTMDNVTCSGGACTGTCKPGFADCDGNLDLDGCEAILNSDPDNCGACGTVCSGNHIDTRGCVAGKCSGICSAGYADCNGDMSDGCEKAVTDADFCSVCSCDDKNGCTADTCVPTTGCVHSSKYFCGDGTCNYGEDMCTCAADCAGPGKDTDGDGLADAWETNGIDTNCDGTGDYALDGADKNVPDVYLEVDYMVTGSYSERYNDSDVTAMVQAFAAQGVTLHVDMTEALQGTGPITMGASACAAPNKVNYWDVRRLHMDPRRSGAYRYGLAGSAYIDPSSGASCSVVTGGGVAAGSPGFVTVGGSYGSEGAMHELGHALGLGHGGGDQLNYKPNYMGVMNYGKNHRSDATGPDYSRQQLPTLTEGNLSETTSFGSADPVDFMYTCQNNLPCAQCQLFGGACVGGPHPCALQASKVRITNQSIDWNCDGVNQSGSVDVNVNNFDGKSPPGESLPGQDDWHNLKYCMSGAGYFGSLLQVPNSPHHLPSLPFPLQVDALVEPQTFQLGTDQTVRVAVLSSSTFDARNIDTGAFTFALTPPISGGTADMNGDGLDDAYADFVISALVLAPTSDSGYVIGKTHDGHIINGVVPISPLRADHDVPPLALCADMTVPAGATCKAQPILSTVSLQQDGDTLTATSTPPGPYGLGAHPITVEVTDGKTSSQCQETITVVDQTPPRVECPGTIEAECVRELGARVDFRAVAEDNCSVASVTCDPPSGSAFGLGASAVRCTARDGAGSSDTCAFAVAVRDDRAPIAHTRAAPQRSGDLSRFLLRECIMDVTDACFGQLDVDSATRITRIEWWPRGSGRGKDELRALEQRFLEHGGSQLALTGPTSAQLPLAGLDDDRGGEYRVFFEAFDPLGNTASGSCRVPVGGNHGPDVGPAACVGADCG